MSQAVQAVGSNNSSPYFHQGSFSGTGGKQASAFNASAITNDGGSFESSVAGDLFQYHAPGQSYWQSNTNPLSIAHDDFSVMGGSVSGNIRPYRLEVGSLAFPYKGVDRHTKYAAIPYLNDYKVPFRYENSISNGYDYHEFLPPAATPPAVSGLIGHQLGYPSDGAIVLKDERLYHTAGTDNPARTAPSRKGIVNQASGTPAHRTRKFVQGKHIAWFNNQELLAKYSTSADGPGDGSFLEINRPTPVTAPGERVFTGEYTTCNQGDEYCQPEPIYRPGPDQLLHNPWRVTLPGKGVGAFAITAEDGTTYHYSLPVYHYTQYSKSRQLTAPTGTQSPGVTTQTTGPRSWHHNGGGYATTWLLTAITSSDYIDRGGESGGGNGTVDATDWGGWVRFDYGRFSSAYKWRQPYSGESYAEDSFNDVSFTEGYKETYYLNSVTTRTHTALFLKSVRNDARGHFQTTPSTLGITETQPASSLRLDEIILLTNEDFARLKTVDGIRAAGDSGPVIPAFSENTADNHTQFNVSELGRYDSYQAVLDQHDVAADARIRTFLNQRALKRVAFNYSYRLCAATPSSFVAVTPLPPMAENQFACTRTGKLTLESLSIYGPANTKLTPDFKFAYGSNPDYQKNAWDGFGMYKSGVPANPNQNPPKAYHQTNTNYATASSDGAAWSLTEITNPLGSKTRISYERDQYSKVSEFGLGSITVSNGDCSNVFTATGLPAGTTLSDFIQANDEVSMVGTFGYSQTCFVYEDCGQGLDWCPNERPCNQEIQGSIRVIDVSGNTLTIDEANVHGPNCNASGGNNCTDPVATGASLNFSVPANKNGGDLRVAAITTLDETGREYQVRYRYTTALRGAANSSGVISKEPAFVVRQAHPFDALFDYPGTPVLYGKVTVYRGAFRQDAATDYDVREEYTFQTPVSTKIQSSQQNAGSLIAQGNPPNTPNAAGYRYLHAFIGLTHFKHYVS